MQTQNTPFPLQQIIDEFGFEGKYTGYRVSNDGHINNTFVVDFKNADGSDVSYLVQLINTNVFKNPDELMENIVGVTAYLRNIVIERGGDPERECLNVFFTKEGKPYVRTDDGECWRCYNFITDAHACQSIDDPKTFYNAAKAFGTFQCLLADYPSNTLHETIPNFHNTRSRFADFKKAVGDDLKGRAAGVRKEIDFVLSRESDTGILVDMLERGELPLRVTHNDTKLNNVMFDNKTDEGICVIDLDTVMPGLSLYDSATASASAQAPPQRTRRISAR